MRPLLCNSMVPPGPTNLRREPSKCWTPPSWSSYDPALLRILCPEPIGHGAPEAISCCWCREAAGRDRSGHPSASPGSERRLNEVPSNVKAFLKPVVGGRVQGRLITMDTCILYEDPALEKKIPLHWAIFFLMVAASTFCLLPHL